MLAYKHRALARPRLCYLCPHGKWLICGIPNYRMLRWTVCEDCMRTCTKCGKPIPKEYRQGKLITCHVVCPPKDKVK